MEEEAAEDHGIREQEVPVVGGLEHVAAEPLAELYHPSP